MNGTSSKVLTISATKDVIPTETCMSPSSLHLKLRCWVARRWYRLLLAMAAGFVIGIPIASACLLGLARSDQSILWGGLAGFACAFFYSFVAVAASITGAMRCPTSIRAAIAVVIPVTAVELLEYVPVNLEIRSIPIVLTYCLCFGSLVTGIGFRYWLDEELVGRGNRLLTRSPMWSDVVLVGWMMLFCWGQYASLGGGWYGSMTAPGVLIWSLVLSAACAWGFVPLCRFRQRRGAFALAIPLAVVAMFQLYLQFRRDSESLLPWSGFLAFAVTAPIGWCLSQEISARAVRACGWQWRHRRRRRRADHATRARLYQAERGWRSLACLFLTLVITSTIPLLTENRDPYQTPRLHSMIINEISLGVAWACLGSMSVLIAHQNRNLLLQSLVMMVCGFSAATISQPKLQYIAIEQTSLLLLTVLPTIPMVIVIHVLVRMLDRFSPTTIGVVPSKRKQVGIDDLMMLTLLLGCGFAMMRFTEWWIVAFGTVLLVSVSTVTLLIFRSYFIGAGLAIRFDCVCVEHRSGAVVLQVQGHV